MSSPSPPFSILWCYSCRRIARYIASSSLVCPSCTSEFVEEIGDPGFLFITGLRSIHDFDDDADVGSRISSARGFFRRLLRRYGRFSFLRRNHHSQASSPFDQELGLIELDASQNLSRPLLGRARSRSDHGSRAEIGNDILARRILDALMQRFASGFFILERPGSRPASKAAVAAMPTITISKENLPLYASDDSEDTLDDCAICKEVFEIGGEVKEMPCKHIYHPECILPWLEFHSSCPLCRSEMPVDEEHTPSSSNEAPTATGGDRAIIVVGISASGAHMFSFIVLGLDNRNDLNNLEREQTAVVDHQVTDDESLSNGVIAGSENAPSTSDGVVEQVTGEHPDAETSRGETLSHEREKVALGENSSHNERIDISRDDLNESGIFPGMFDASNLSANPRTEISSPNSHRMLPSGNLNRNRSRSFFSWIYRRGTSSQTGASNSSQDHFSSSNSDRRENTSSSP